MRVLILEDEVLVAMHLEDLLANMGHEVVGSVTRVNPAIPLARNEDIDFAILDVNVAGSPSYPIADILRQRGISFVFATGYGSAGLADGYRHQPTLSKPYEAHELELAIAAGRAAPISDRSSPTGQGSLSGNCAADSSNRPLKP
jgi:DNA-binding NarL/FixJ family response regulator